MAITAMDIQEQGFGTARNGYDMQEVDVFLEHVAAEIDQMQADFQMQLQQAMASANNGNVAQYEMEIQRLNAIIANLQSQLSVQQNDASVISEAIIAAQKSANQMKEDARLESEKAYREAEAKAREIVGEAASERQRILGEIERLEKSRQSFVDQYVGLIKHFQDEATRTFPAELVNAPVAKADEPAPTALFETEPQKSYGVAASNADASYPAQQVPVAAVSYDDEFDIEEID